MWQPEDMEQSEGMGQSEDMEQPEGMGQSEDMWKPEDSVRDNQDNQPRRPLPLSSEKEKKVTTCHLKFQREVLVIIFLKSSESYPLGFVLLI